MTQSQLAETLGVTDKAVSRWERAVGFPDISLLEPLAQVLGVTVAELMRSERMAEELPAGEVEQIVIRALDLAEEQQKNALRGRLLTFGLIPLVLLADLFLSNLIDRYVGEPDWVRVAGIGLVSWCVVLAVLGIRYIASCGYAAARRKLPAAFWVSTVMTCLGVGMIGFALCLPGPKPEWFSLMVVLAAMLACVSPMYLYHLITNEIRDWNRWAGGRDI